MTQYDAGPGDWSDREWETPEHKHKAHAKRRLTLPLWALVALLVAAVVILCVGGVLIVKALRSGGSEATPAASTPQLPAVDAPTPTFSLATEGVPPTPTVELPLPPTVETPPTTIAPGARVKVTNTGGVVLVVRAAPNGARLGTVAEGAELVVLEGPEAAGDYNWWKIKTAAGLEGWVAADFLALVP